MNESLFELLSHIYRQSLAQQINVTFSRQCSNVLIFGITRLRQSRERIMSRLYMSPVSPVFYTEVTVNIGLITNSVTLIHKITVNRNRHARGPVQTSVLLHI